MIQWVAIFLFSAVLDIGAVLFTRSVQMQKILFGMLTTAVIAMLSWGSILLVVEQDSYLVIPSVIGHVFGYFLGMKIPVSAASEK